MYKTLQDFVGNTPLVRLVLIAGINVISAVSTMILDKKNQIAILRTLGATAATVRRVINYQILLFCLIAIIIGQALGALLMSALCWLVIAGPVALRWARR